MKKDKGTETPKRKVKKIVKGKINSFIKVSFLACLPDSAALLNLKSFPSTS
jgi:hypothetical protein